MLQCENSFRLVVVLLPYRISTTHFVVPVHHPPLLSSPLLLITKKTRSSLLIADPSFTLWPYHSKAPLTTTISSGRFLMTNNATREGKSTDTHKISLLPTAKEYHGVPFSLAAAPLPFILARGLVKYIGSISNSRRHCKGHDFTMGSWPVSILRHGSHDYNSLWSQRRRHCFFALQQQQ